MSMDRTPPPPNDLSADRDRAEQLVRRIVSECPDRSPGSKDEHRAQVILRAQLTRLGGRAVWRRFRFSKSLYLVLGLHFTLAVVASALFFVTPLVAATIHALLAISYICDSNRWGYLLRSLLPSVTASNLVVTFPSRQPMRRRIVITAHADAAPTGWMFQQSGLGSVEKTPKLLRQIGRPLLIAVIGLFAVSAIEIKAWATDASFLTNHPGAFYGFSIYFAVLAVLNMQVWWNNATVAGANDNLSACAALPILAKRLKASQPDDIELVFVVTACEEAGTGGAYQLARELRGEWGVEETDVVVLDSIGGGELSLFQEGEMIPWRIPPHLEETVLKAAQADERFENLVLFPLPAGATDATAFLSRGFHAICLGRIDRRLGTPCNYHLPGDTPDNLDFDAVIQTVDFVERVARSLAGAPADSEPDASADSPSPGQRAISRG